MLLIDGAKPKEITLPHNIPNTVVFELIDTAKGKRRLANGGTKQINSTYLIPMKYSIVDPSTGDTTEIIYSGTRQIPFQNGVVQSNFEPEPLAISGDIVKSKVKDKEIIFAMLNSVYCEDNPKYTNAKDKLDLKPIFRVKNLKNASVSKNDNFKRVSEALSYITNEDKITNVKVAKLYKAGGYTDADILIDNEEFSVMRAILTELATKDVEKFFKIFEDGLSDVRVTIQDAVKGEVIAYVDGKGWVWKTTKGAHNKPLICNVPRGKELKDAVEILINFLKLKDETGVYEEIKKELSEK